MRLSKQRDPACNFFHPHHVLLSRGREPICARHMRLEYRTPSTQEKTTRGDYDMKKTTRLRLLLTAAIALLVSVLLASCGSPTSPANRPLEPAATAGPAVQESVSFGKSQVGFKIVGRNGGGMWRRGLSVSVPTE